MKQADKKQLLLLGLKKYVEYLNHFMEDGEYKYSIDSFTVNKPKQHLYGRNRILSVTEESSNADVILHAVVDDGDEGGTHDLIIGFRNSDWSNRKMNYSTFNVDWVVRGFDGSFDMIFNNNQFLHDAEGAA